MQIKASTDYGLRAVLYLAKTGSICSSRDIASNMAIPRDYFIQLAQPLRNAGIIDAKPGKHGGYLLAKAPSQISLLEVIDALEEEPKMSSRLERSCHREATMVNNVKFAYQLILRSYDSYLDSISIEMLLKCAKNPDEAYGCLAESLGHEAARLQKVATGV